jgi:hypothetical protein
MRPTVILLSLTLASWTVPASVRADGPARNPVGDARQATAPVRIRGHVWDASGAAIVGARIGLHGATDATRFTDLMGGFAFRVPPGSYTVTGSDDCAITGASADAPLRLDAAADVVQDFTAAGNGCVSAKPSNVSTAGCLILLSRRGRVESNIEVRVKLRSTPAEALEAFRAIVADERRALGFAKWAATERVVLRTAPWSHLFTIAGSPVVQTRTVYPPARGPERGPNIGWRTALLTGIVTGSTAVEFTSQVPLGQDDPATVARLFGLARDFPVDELGALYTLPPKPEPSFSTWPSLKPMDPPILPILVADPHALEVRQGSDQPP